MNLTQWKPQPVVSSPIVAPQQTVRDRQRPREGQPGQGRVDPRTAGGRGRAGAHDHGPVRRRGPHVTGRSGALHAVSRQLARAALACVAVPAALLAGGCAGPCEEDYLAGFEQVRADGVPHGEFRDAQPFASGAVAVGDAGTIARVDADGLVAVDGGVDVDLHALIVVPDLLAVGDAGTILRSDDGARWDQVDAGTDADLYGAARSGDGGEIVVVGDDAVLLSSDGGARWTAMAGEAAGPLRAVAFAHPGFLAFSADGDVIAVDTAAGTHAPLGLSLGAAVRNVEYDAVGDAWLVLVDGSVWIGSQVDGAWQFSSGGSGYCGTVGFRRAGEYVLCDNGWARDRNDERDEPSLRLEPFVPARAVTPLGDGFVVFGEDGVARQYAPVRGTRPAEHCPK